MAEYNRHIERIANVRKNENGDIVAVRTDKGNVYSIDEAINKVKANEISGVTVEKDSSGKERLASNPTGLHYSFLDDVPEF
ncbi:MAG: DUF3892 domain-containing protein [Clostridiales bacterium]|uniref:DUF3892 domain-containing protein n=1 Tax=Clostridium sp. N3C TaxID=1776758 RepID=UPI00092DFC0C|nr:DUF3892 domain-containing protein [Clostridium sp. N3C]NLZ49990.1 DUF3892 domain-containing protein [Clostridiales bacterium]SCN25676.1 hypothetical protein N3C_2430 [Clostridium sp. N3C]